MTVKGIDVAYYEPKIDWLKVKNAGYEFAFIKASQGTVEDPKFKEHWNGAKGILPRGAYHLYDPRYPKATAKAQAEFFWSLVKEDPGELPFVADIEKYESGPYHGSQQWYNFLETLKMLSNRKEAMIYTAQYYWQDNVNLAGKSVTDVSYFYKNYPLWIADPDPVQSPSMPKNAWLDWLFWQINWTTYIDGITDEEGRKTACDVDIFNGTTEQFNKRFGVGNPQLPVPPVKPPLKVSISRGAKIIFEEEIYDD